MNIVIIPARGGSKRIPKKNLRAFRGKPMISWPIQAAKKANCFDKIIVSTDSTEIASIASAEGAWIPFLRPADLSDDYTTTKTVVLHSINWLKKNKFEPKFVCCLYATAPFVKPSDLKNGLELIYKQKEDKFVFTATNYAFPIQRAIRLNSKGISSMFNPKYFNTRSQDLEKAYHDAGQFYIANPKTWSDKNNLFENSAPILIPNWRVQDIDEEDDWLRAEMMHQILENMNL